jgi:PKD repeat protein
MIYSLNVDAQVQKAEGYEIQSRYRLVRGERPPIDLNKVPDDAFEKGKIKIKIAPELEGNLPFDVLKAENNGCVATGNRMLDALNTKYNVKSYKPLFMDLYATGSKSSQSVERHRAWGFQRWFVLEIDRNADVKAAVFDYSQVNGIEWAEPEYKKILITEGEPVVVKTPVEPPAVEDETKWTPNDPWFPSQWHYNNTGQAGGTPGADLDMVNAWNINKGNPNVIVAVIDQGVQYDHPDLQNNMWSGLGWNFATNSSTIVPELHGTFVAGIIAASNNNATGVSSVAGESGAGTGVKIMICQVFSDSQEGGFELAPVYAADNGAALTQNSWTYTEPYLYDQAVLDAIDYFNEYGGGNAMEGGISFFSAGNYNSSELYYPSAYTGCVAVAATTNQDAKTSYSNYGSWVDISAPGGSMETQNEAGILSTISGSLYAWWEGTSFACPHGSGVAALMASLSYGMLSSDIIKEVMLSSAENIDGLNPGYAGQLGTGRVDAYNALQSIQTILTLPQNPLTFAATAVGPNQINLSWQKNNNNNNVIVLWNTTTVFGQPQNGVNYNVGDVIPGGGVVLYKGSNTAYQHNNLQNGTYYYYKAFSYNNNPDYSYGRTASAVTSCQTFAVLPFNQDFNANPTIPDCWTVIDHFGNGQVWKVGTFGGGLTGTTPFYAYLNSDQYGSGNSQNSDLITPKLDLSNYMNVTLNFKHYFWEFPESSATLSYSTNDGATWTQIQQWTTTTDNPATFSQQINGLDCQPAVRFKWNYTGTFGMFWCIDDVSITGTTPPVPYADFTASPITTMVAEPVMFTDASGGGIFSSWQWNFGQDAIPATATGRGPHLVTYSSEGSKTVSLVVNGTYSVTKTNYITITPNPNVVSAVYTYGDIMTDFGFQSLPGNSFCPGHLTVNIPTGAVITKVDVSYSMTASAGGFMEEQRSQLRCISAGGTAETQIFSGTGSSAGTQNYYRAGLNIANNVTGGGPIVFQLHAGRTWGGDMCSLYFNKVNNNTWKVTIHFEVPDPVPDFTATPTILPIGSSVTFTDASTGGYVSSWSWNFGSGASPATASGQGPHQVVYNSGGYKTVSLTVNDEFTKTRTNYITVLDANFTSNVTNVCSGNNVQFYDQSAGGPTSWTWDFPGGTPSSSTAQNPNINYASQGSYNVSLTISKGGVSNQELKQSFITVIALAGPAGEIAGEETVCAGTTLTYTIPQITNATSYEWVIVPTGAATLVGNSNSCAVSWNNSYTGAATINVRGYNQCNYGDWSPDFEVFVLDCNVSGLPADWNITQTPTIHPIKILPETTISVLGEPATDGTPIGVFYLDDANAEQCGGALLYYTNQTQWMAAFGDNINTPSIDGFQTGDDFIWKIYNSQTQQSLNATAVYDPSIPNSGGFYQGSHSELLSLSNGLSLSLDLPAGWSGFSIPFNPSTPSVVDIFSQCYSNLVILQQFSYLYWPAYYVNSFPAWQNSFGAQLKMAQSCTIDLVGTEGSSTIDLPSGWSFLSVPSMSNVSANEVFSPIESKIDIVKTIPAFKFWWPSIGIFTLDVLEPGNAYYIRLNQPATLTFPTSKQSEVKSNDFKFIVPAVWGNVNPTPENHLIAISSEIFEYGDFVGAFTFDGICAGSVQISDPINVLTVFGNDPLTDEKDGFNAGDFMDFRILRGFSGESSKINITWRPDFPDYSGLFVPNGISSFKSISITSDIQSKNLCNLTVFPNPCNGKFTITGIAEFDHLDIINISGIIIFEKSLTGENSLTVNQLENNQGIFYIKLAGINGSAFAKILVY